MLILTRRMGESIIIGDGDNKIEVIVLATKGSQVRLGIDAPKDISVHRNEIFEKIKNEKKIKQKEEHEEK